MNAQDILMVIGEVDEQLLEETEQSERPARTLPLRRVILVAAIIGLVSMLLGATVLHSIPIHYTAQIQSDTDFVMIYDENSVSFLSPPPVTDIVVDVNLSENGPIQNYYLPKVPSDWTMRSAAQIEENAEVRYVWDLPSGGFAVFHQISPEQYEACNHVVDGIATIPAREYIHSETLQFGPLNVLQITLEPLTDVEQRVFAYFTDYMVEGEKRIYWSDGKYVFSFRCPASITQEDITVMLSNLTEIPEKQVRALASGNTQEKEEFAMKRIYAFCAAVVLTLFGTGCESGDIPAETTNTVPQIVETTEALYAPGNSLIEYDPDREIYIHCSNVQTTGYMGQSGYWLPLTIYSKEHLIPEDIRVEMDAQNDYRINYISENVAGRDTQYNQFGDIFTSDSSYYPYHLFQVRQGTDFTLAGHLWGLYLNPPEFGTEEYEAMQVLIGEKTPWQAHEELMQEHWESYLAMTPENIPEFYVYNLNLEFNGSIEESIQEMTFYVNDVPYKVSIGNLHLVPEGIPQTYPLSDAVYMDCAVLDVPSVNYYGNGMASFTAFTFTATDAMKLKELKFPNGDATLVSASLFITSGGMTVESSWDGKSEVLLYPGDMVDMHIVVQSPHLHGIHYHIDLLYELFMTVEEEPYCLSHQVSISSFYANYHEIYAMVFEGLDMESYYRDYYYAKSEMWRSEHED